MKVLELFSGTASFSKVAKERGHQTFTIDFDKSFNPDLCIDLLDFDISMLPEEFRHPDVIWASPPCQKFSVMTVYKNWEKKGLDYYPKNKEAIKACFIVFKTLEIIKELNPKSFIIENPRGMLRKQEFMLPLFRNTVTYCQYGLPYQKATDLWNNLKNWYPKPMCSPKSPCHQRSPRGSRLGIQGVDGFRINREQKHPKDVSRTNHVDWDYGVVRSPALRAVVPKELCNEILNSIEKEAR